MTEKFVQRLGRVVSGLGRRRRPENWSDVSVITPRAVCAAGSDAMVSGRGALAGSAQAARTTQATRRALAFALTQLIEGSCDIHARHLLPPRQIKIGVVHRLLGTLGCLCSRGNCP